MFHRKIYGIPCLRATEFDGDWGGIPVVDKFNFCGMGDDTFVVRGVWWSGIGRNEIFFSFSGGRGVAPVFFGFRMSDMMDVRAVRYCM